MFSPIRKRTPWTVDHNASLISPKDNFLYPNTRLNFQSEKEEKGWRQKTKQQQQQLQLQLQQLLKLELLLLSVSFHFSYITGQYEYIDLQLLGAPSGECFDMLSRRPILLFYVSNLL